MLTAAEGFTSGGTTTFVTGGGGGDTMRKDVVLGRSVGEVISKLT